MTGNPMSLDQLFKQINDRGWRVNMGHTPHWYSRNELPKNLRKKPFEAYVTNGEPIGTFRYIFESSDGATIEDALQKAYDLAVAKEQFKKDNPPQEVQKKRK